MITNENISEVIVDEWPRSNRETIRVTLQWFQGRWVFSIRAWYRNGAGEWRPGRDGITLGVAHLPRVLNGYVELHRLASERGLIDPDNDNARS